MGELYQYEFIVQQEEGREIVLYGFRLSNGEKVLFPQVEPEKLGAKWDEELKGWYL